MEQTVLQCLNCFCHTPLIETESGESINEAIIEYCRCKQCGSYAMLCFESKVVKVGKAKQLSWRSANAPRTRSKARRRRNPRLQNDAKDKLLRMPSMQA